MACWALAHEGRCSGPPWAAQLAVAKRSPRQGAQLLHARDADGGALLDSALRPQMTNVVGKRYGVHATTRTERYKGQSQVRRAAPQRTRSPGPPIPTTRWPALLRPRIKHAIHVVLAPITALSCCCSTLLSPT